MDVKKLVSALRQEE